MEEIFEANKSMLKSMLLDEEKLITYMSLSKDLCIHVNNSKMLLRRTVENVRQEKPDLQLNVTYVISGSTDSHNAKTIVCKEQDLTKLKDGFSNIFFEHIYSVNVGSPTIDTAAYLTVNKLDDLSLCTGLIKSNQCDKRTSAEIGDLKTSSQEIVVPEKSKSLPVPAKTAKQETNTIKSISKDMKPISRDNESKSEPIIKQEVISPKKETTVPNHKPKSTSSNGHKTQKGIVGFFSKSNLNGDNKKEVKKNVQKDKEETEKQVVKVEKIEVKRNIQNGKEVNKETVKQDVDVEKMEVEEASPKAPKIISSSEENHSNKLLNQIKKTSKVDKKRKRVLHVSDSDSDHENNDPFVDDSKEQVAHESDDEIPPTPTTNNIKITSGIINPKKRRKVVDKTYTDEEGYILTKKVEVYESCSENEEEIKIEEKPEPKVVKNEISPKGKTSGPKKKVSPPQKGKQPTLTNFFKKV